MKEIYLTVFFEEYGVNRKVCKSAFLLLVSCRRKKELIILLRRPYVLHLTVKSYRRGKQIGQKEMLETATSCISPYREYLSS
jgi:hypothetical protein